MASAESGYLKDLYGGWMARLAANPEMDLDTVRDVFEEWHLATAEPEGVGYADADVDGTSAIWCIPGGCAAEAAILYFHGGGCVVGSMYSHRKLAGHLAKATGVRALVLDFHRAPEVQFPGQIDEGVAAFRWLVAQGIEPARIATMGDSAGGNLAITVPLKLRDLGVALPGAIVALSPWVGLELDDETFESRAATDGIWGRPLWEQMVTTYLGEASPEDPLANPIHADLAGLPPTYLTAGDHEVLVGPDTRFAALAEKAGVEVVLHVEPDQQHVFELMAGRAPEADAAVARIGAWLRPKLGLS